MVDPLGSISSPSICRRLTGDVYKRQTQLLLRIEACGICFSDTKLLHAFDGHPRKRPVSGGLTPTELAEIPSYHPDEEPTVPGHEPVARVIAVGDQVTRYAIGDRVLVQADWRHLPTSASNSAFGYNFEGALQEYVVVDERVVVSGAEEFLLRVGEAPSAAAVALVEPWSTVEASYSRAERTALSLGGNLLVVSDGNQPSGLPELLSSSPPERITVVGADPRSVAPRASAGTLDTLDAGFDDIVYYRADAATVEKLSGLLGVRGLLCVVLGGSTLDRPVSIDVGRIHYDFVRYIGTTGDNPAMPTSTSPRAARSEPATGLRSSVPQARWG